MDESPEAQVLRNLVELKHYKDLNGKTHYYKKRQKILWVQAQALLGMNTPPRLEMFTSWSL